MAYSNSNWRTAISSLVESTEHNLNLVRPVTDGLQPQPSSSHRVQSTINKLNADPYSASRSELSSLLSSVQAALADLRVEVKAARQVSRASMAEMASATSPSPASYALPPQQQQQQQQALPITAGTPPRYPSPSLGLNRTLSPNKVLPPPAFPPNLSPQSTGSPPGAMGSLDPATWSLVASLLDARMTDYATRMERQIDSALRARSDAAQRLEAAERQSHEALEAVAAAQKQMKQLTSEVDVKLTNIMKLQKDHWAALMAVPAQVEDLLAWRVTVTDELARLQDTLATLQQGQQQLAVDVLDASGVADHVAGLENHVQQLLETQAEAAAAAAAAAIAQELPTHLKDVGVRLDDLERKIGDQQQQQQQQQQGAAVGQAEEEQEDAPTAIGSRTLPAGGAAAARVEALQAQVQELDGQVYLFSSAITDAAARLRSLDQQVHELRAADATSRVEALEQQVENVATKLMQVVEDAAADRAAAKRQQEQRSGGSGRDWEADAERERRLSALESQLADVVAQQEELAQQVEQAAALAAAAKPSAGDGNGAVAERDNAVAEREQRISAVEAQLADVVAQQDLLVQQVEEVAATAANAQAAATAGYEAARIDEQRIGGLEQQLADLVAQQEAASVADVAARAAAVRSAASAGAGADGAGAAAGPGVPEDLRDKMDVFERQLNDVMQRFAPGSETGMTSARSGGLAAHSATSPQQQPTSVPPITMPSFGSLLSCDSLGSGPSAGVLHGAAVSTEVLEQLASLQAQVAKLSQLADEQQLPRLTDALMDFGHRLDVMQTQVAALETKAEESTAAAERAAEAAGSAAAAAASAASAAAAPRGPSGAARSSNGGDGTAGASGAAAASEEVIDDLNSRLFELKVSVDNLTEDVGIMQSSYKMRIEQADVKASEALEKAEELAGRLDGQTRSSGGGDGAAGSLQSSPSEDGRATAAAAAAAVAASATQREDIEKLQRALDQHSSRLLKLEAVTDQLRKDVASAGGSGSGSGSGAAAGVTNSPRADVALLKQSVAAVQAELAEVHEGFTGIIKLTAEEISTRHAALKQEIIDLDDRFENLAAQVADVQTQLASGAGAVVAARAASQGALSASTGNASAHPPAAAAAPQPQGSQRSVSSAGQSALRAYGNVEGGGDSRDVSATYDDDSDEMVVELGGGSGGGAATVPPAQCDDEEAAEVVEEEDVAAAAGSSYADDDDARSESLGNSRRSNQGRRPTGEGGLAAINKSMMALMSASRSSLGSAKSGGGGGGDATASSGGGRPGGVDLSVSSGSFPAVPSRSLKGELEPQSPRSSYDVDEYEGRRQVPQRPAQVGALAQSGDHATSGQATSQQRQQLPAGGYKVVLVTGVQATRGVDAIVHVALEGDLGRLDDTPLTTVAHRLLPGSMEQFYVGPPGLDLGPVRGLTLWYEGGGAGSWCVDRVIVDSTTTGDNALFVINDWLDSGRGAVRTFRMSDGPFSLTAAALAAGQQRPPPPPSAGTPVQRPPRVLGANIATPPAQHRAPDDEMDVTDIVGVAGINAVLARSASIGSSSSSPSVPGGGGGVQQMQTPPPRSGAGAAAAAAAAATPASAGGSAFRMAFSTSLSGGSGGSPGDSLTFSQDMLDLPDLSAPGGKAQPAASANNGSSAGTLVDGSGASRIPLAPSAAVASRAVASLLQQPAAAVAAAVAAAQPPQQQQQRPVSASGRPAGSVGSVANSGNKDKFVRSRTPVVSQPMDAAAAKKASFLVDDDEDEEVSSTFRPSAAAGGSILDRR